jgi:glycosyltransferase involved in cell wall biosynthesis
VPHTLIVVVAGRISEWATKGEVPRTYFNPTNGFSRIFIISLVPDAPNREDLAKLCGSAEYDFISIDLLSWRGLAKTLLIPWLVKKAVIRSIDDKFSRNDEITVRAYGDTFAGMAAALIGKHYRCKSVASIHTTHTHQPANTRTTAKELLLRGLENFARRYTHANTDALAPVYSPAVSTIAPRYRSKTHLIPNAVGVAREDIKSSYQRAKESLSLVTVGRLISGKSTLPLLEAVRQIPETNLTIIGDGPERQLIEGWIKQHQISERVTLVERRDNASLIKGLKDFDAFIAYTEFAEVPKTVIEAGLVGLPIILNKPADLMPIEYDGVPICWVEGAHPSYREAIALLIDDALLREQYGNQIRKKFEILFDPDTCSKHMFELLTNRKPETQGGHQAQPPGSSGSI